jgi:uncharacterized protein (TIGR02001 family)
LLLAGSTARASEDWDFRGSASVLSNYVYEGVSQSWNRPAAQVEVEAEHSSGGYAGAFASTISPRQFPGGNVELEAWIGYGYEFSQRFNVAAELAYFAFPGANLANGWCATATPCPAQSFNTGQLRLLAQWNWLTLQIGYSLSDYFGASAASGFSGSTRGTVRAELGVEHALPGDGRWSVALKAGYTHYPATLITPVLPGVDGGGPDYTVWLRRRFEINNLRLDLTLGVAGTSRGVTSRSLTDSAQTRLGGPTPWIGVSLGL